MVKSNVRIRDKIVLVEGDITDANVDAIVNAANTDLQLGGGVAGAIRRKGGAQIQADCNKVGPVELGEAAVTRAGGMKARYVIHAAAMRLGQKVTQESLRQATLNALKRADEKGAKSVAFPAIGTGIGGYHIDACAHEMLRLVHDYLKANAGTTHIEEVRFFLYDRDSFDRFQKAHAALPAD